MEKLKKLQNRFIAGICNAGTPFSAKRKLKKGKYIINNPIRLKADKLMNEKEFKNDTILDSACYFTGGIIGLTISPIDAVVTFCGDVKETFKLN